MPTALHRFAIGGIEAVVIADDYEVMPPERFNGIFNRPEDSPIRGAFAELAGPLFSFNCLYLRTPDRQILIDTGEGKHPPRPHGFLREGLERAGVRAGEIDTVILTHFHIDHIGGLIDSEGALIYPEARLVAPRGEWEHWMREEVLAGLDEFRRETLQRGLRPYAEAGRLTLPEPGEDITPGIRFVPMPGHTPGHCGLSIESEGERLLHMADAAHVPLQLKHPGAVPRFDWDPQLAGETRRAVFERAARERELVALYHFPFPGLGRVVEKEDGLEWEVEGTGGTRVTGGIVSV